MIGIKPVTKKKRFLKTLRCMVFLALGLLLSGDLSIAQSQAPQENGLVLKAYSCPIGIIESTTARLKEIYKGQPDVRITANVRSAEILVYAPYALQFQVADSIASIKNSTLSQTNRSDYIPTNPVNALTGKSYAIPLQHINGKQLEEALLKMMGNRLSKVAPTELGAISFNLVLPSGENVRLDILPQLNTYSVYGTGTAANSFARLIKTLDTPASTADESLQLVSLNKSSISATRRAIEAIKTADMNKIPHDPVVTRLMQDPRQGAANKNGPTLLAQAQMSPEEEEETTTQVVPAPGQLTTEKGLGEIGQIGPVQVEMLEGLDVLIIRGHKRDVEQVMNVIKQVELLSAKTEPAIEIYKFKNIDSEASQLLLRQIYDEVYLLRQGNVSITALVKPNALLIIGRKENVKTVLDLVQSLDQPVPPDTQFQVFRLKHTSSSSAATTIRDFYIDRLGLGTKVTVTDDSRSNSLIVHASPRDMAEVAELIDRIDTSTSAAVNDLRIVPLEHSMADALATIINNAISGQAAAPTAPRAPTGAPTGAAAQAARAATSTTGSEQRSAVLRFLTVDAKGHQLLQSGVLKDVTVSPDPRSNSLIVSAPSESMDLLVALIHELDRLPVSDAWIKVFRIENGDANNLSTMLQGLFGVRQGAGAGAGGAFGAGGAAAGLQTVALEGEGSMVPVRIAVDTRTNTIIASGGMNDLKIIEAILVRLDTSDVRRRESHVYRLKNAPAASVNTAINTFLTNVRTMQTQLAPGTVSPFTQIEQEVIVVPEPVSNSLIVSATPRFFEEIKKIINDLDERPPMVMIQVVIAEVTLSDNEEFGVEMGLQDGLLFDRSAAITSTTAGNTLNPGFPFNNLPLGNAVNVLANNPGNAQQVGTQGLSNFSVGRSNPNLGFGGFVFSASSESVSILIRALKQNQRVEVLSRPQIMTLDNQQAYVFVGQNVPYIANVNTTTFGQTNSVQWINAGLGLLVTPRISPDNIVSMAVEAQKSRVDQANSVPITAINGQIITQPSIDTTQAQTTISAANGQTVVLGGLITRSKEDIHRKVPWVGDIPVVGRLFRFDSVANNRTELLIILTPHVVRNKDEADQIKQVEAARMNWCLGNVVELSGETSLRPRNGDWSDKDTEVIYPDINPRAEKPTAIEEKPSDSEFITTPPANGSPAGNTPPQDSVTPPQPPYIQHPGTGAVIPQKHYMYPNKKDINTSGQMQSQTPKALPSVQATTYEQPKGNTYNTGSQNNIYATGPNDINNNVAPTVYDAPPRYPTTQQPFYR